MLEYKECFFFQNNLISLLDAWFPQKSFSSFYLLYYSSTAICNRQTLKFLILNPKFIFLLENRPDTAAFQEGPWGRDGGTSIPQSHKDAKQTRVISSWMYVHFPRYRHKSCYCVWLYCVFANWMFVASLYWTNLSVPFVQHLFTSCLCVTFGNPQNISNIIIIILLVMVICDQWPSVLLFCWGGIYWKWQT